MNSLEKSFRDILAWEDGTGTRVMKHTVTVGGRRHVIEAATQKEFKDKLRQLQEFEDNDGA